MMILAIINVIPVTNFIDMSKPGHIASISIPAGIILAIPFIYGVYRNSSGKLPVKSIIE